MTSRANPACEIIGTENFDMYFKSLPLAAGLLAALALSAPIAPAQASSHMDAPLITLDAPANTTDVYAFRSTDKENGDEYLTTALAVYPFEEPGIGPNTYRFDDRVRYEIHVALDDDVGAGKKTITYRFDFRTKFADRNTILQSYLGVIDGLSTNAKGFDANQNLRQRYKVTKIDHRTGRRTVLGRGNVPPNNQGLVTPFYNTNNDGDQPAKEGVRKSAELDRYTRDAITSMRKGYRAFAGQRDDGFYADIQSIFDLDFAFGRDPDDPTKVIPTKPFDSQGGFNLHMVALDIPMSELGEAERAGVYATTSRRRLGDWDNDDDDDDDDENDDRRGREHRDDDRYVQVGRQGNPLFAEALVAIVDKDRYNRTEPTGDARRFIQYAQNVELAMVLNSEPIADIVGLFVPDVIKVDLLTPAARTPLDSNFNRLGGFGGDMLTNRNGEAVSGGWPNGRRFGDDVLDIAIIAIGVAGDGPFDGVDVDGVTQNDITFNDVFPYAATPLNGRNHGHHGEPGIAF